MDDYRGKILELYSKIVWMYLDNKLTIDVARKILKIGKFDLETWKQNKDKGIDVKKQIDVRLQKKVDGMENIEEAYSELQSNLHYAGLDSLFNLGKENLGKAANSEEGEERRIRLFIDMLRNAKTEKNYYIKNEEQASLEYRNLLANIVCFYVNGDYIENGISEDVVEAIVGRIIRHFVDDPEYILEKIVQVKEMISKKANKGIIKEEVNNVFKSMKIEGSPRSALNVLKEYLTDVYVRDRALVRSPEQTLIFASLFSGLSKDELRQKKDDFDAEYLKHR